MRIAINCRSFLKRQYAGIGRYAFNLVKSLSELDGENEYWLYVQKKYFDFKRQVPRVTARNFEVKIDWLGRGIASALKSVDIYHSPSPDFIHMEPPTKVIVTIHDLVYKTYPEGHTQQARDTTDEQLGRIVAQADKLICCSNNTIQDLCKYFPVDTKKISLVYQGVDNNIFYPLNPKELAAAKKLLERKGVKGPFILFVGTIEPRKNLQNLLLALSELKLKSNYKGKLVVVGMKGWMIEGLDQVIRNLSLQNDIIFPGYVTDEELRHFYNLTDLFIFPSFYEGFGFPIVEAFSCGAAVITSNISSCPEIAGDSAMLVNPYNPEDIANAMAKVLDDKLLRECLQQKGLKRAKDFSFQKTAEETLAVYKEVYGKN